MANQTQESINLECSNLIDGLDKAAAKVESFSDKATKAITEVDKAAEQMSETQKRAYDVIKTSYSKHADALKELVPRYEALREKQKSGVDMTKQEKAELQHITGEYKKHSGAIITLTSDLNRLANQFKNTGKESQSMMESLKGFNITQAFESAVGGLTAIITSKIAGAVTELIGDIASLGLETQQVTSQFGAMANNLSDATATYQMFNDVARNTNYDFAAVNEMGKQLLNMGYSAKNAADLIQLCSDTAAGLGQGVSGAQQLVQVISRIQSTGEMSSKQLVNLQMAGIDTDKVFAKIGMSSDQAMQALKDGTLDSQKAISLLTDYMHEFDGSMNKSKENIADAWGDVTGNIATACGEIGADIANAFMKSEIVQDLIDFTQRLIELVRGDGSGAWSDFGQVAQVVLDTIAGLLKAVETAILVVVMAVDELWSGFKSMGKSVYDYLSWLLEPLGEIFTVVKNIVTALGKAVAADVNSAWTKRFKVPERNVDNSNHFKARTRTSAPGGGSGSANKLSEEEKQIEALIKKYADASKIAKERGKIALQVAGLNASMLVGEAKAQEELKNKIDGFKQNHEDVLRGYEKELELANKISNASIRNDTINSIKEQIAAQDTLFKKQVEAANWQAEFAKMQKQDGKLLDNILGDPESTQAKINTMQEQLKTFLADISAMEATDQAGGSVDMTSMSEESQSILKQLLNKTPEQLQQEFDTKTTSFIAFCEQLKTAMAEAAKTEKENLTIGEQWKNMQVQWVGNIGKSMGNAVSEWIMGSKSIGQAMKDMVKNLISQAVQLLAQWTMVFALVSAFTNPKTGAAAANKIVLGIGDWKGFATGGFVAGPGTSTSDSIPAMLSDGEYVLNAAAVRAVGIGTLDAVNYGRSAHFADGGAVGDAGAAPIGGNVTINVSTIDASGFATFLENGALDTIKQAMFEDSRRFASDVGVW